MSIWEITTPMLTGFTVGQLLRYLQVKAGTATFDTTFHVKYFLYSLLLVVAVAGGVRWLMPGDDRYYMVVSGIWLAVFAFLYWRTKVLNASRKA
jgi:hypothetical protein